jgi:O-methyltransferase domain
MWAGCGFDLPEIAPVFEEYVEQNGLAARLAFVPGNFFTGQMPTADVLMMGHILGVRPRDFSGALPIFSAFWRLRTCLTSHGHAIVTGWLSDGHQIQAACRLAGPCLSTCKALGIASIRGSNGTNTPRHAGRRGTESHESEAVECSSTITTRTARS